MSVLQVKDFNFDTKANAERHHTSKYDIVNEGKSVVRRGEPFKGTVSFTRAFDEGEDTLQLVFSLGNSQTKTTFVTVNINQEKNEDKISWSGNILDVAGDTITFEVTSPVSAPVGRWAVRVVTRRKASDARLVYNQEGGIYILLNPWHPDDQTYMKNTGLLQEYVLEEFGKVWQGGKGKPWLYGQFDRVVLAASLFVLDDRAKLAYEDRGNPVLLARAISRVVNANNDEGVVVGAWQKEYPDGTAPTLWTGSVEILDQFHRTQKPVRYGQCWVFAGVVTTVCRALGLPCRPVTNVVSAHDKDKSLSVDMYYDENMRPVEYKSDFIWNYHVWNDVWMSRPDLGEGYDGWQAIDATPQELSDGFMQCGPAPVKAIKKGELIKDYDVGFLMASVNADYLRWIKFPSKEEHSVVDTNDFHIGRYLYTKKPHVFDQNGEEDRDDVMHLYKYKDGSEEEREAFRNAVGHSESAKRYYELARPARVHVFRLHKLDFVDIGQDFHLSISAENNSDEGRDITMSLVVFSIFSNGKVAEEVKRIDNTTIWMGKNNREEMKMKVTPEEYLPKLVEGLHLRLHATALVQGTDYAWADEDDFTFRTPLINIDFNEPLTVGQDTTAVLWFRNPLKISLTSCEFRLNSAGFEGQAQSAQVADVDPNQVVRVEMQVKPIKPGPITIGATFQSAELNSVSGSTKEIVE